MCIAYGVARRDCHMAPESGKLGQRITPEDIARMKTGYELEDYTPERVAEFLLSNAVDAEDHVEAVGEVRRMGLDPEKTPHQKPPGA